MCVRPARTRWYFYFLIRLRLPLKKLNKQLEFREVSWDNCDEYRTVLFIWAKLNGGKFCTFFDIQGRSAPRRRGLGKPNKSL